MIPSLRKRYNEQFTAAAYAAFLDELRNVYPGQLDFRVAETPLFVPAAFTKQMMDACEAIIDVVMSPAYAVQAKHAVPAGLDVPNEDAQPHFIAFDFGICRNAAGGIEPQLIEMQGFPSLFAYQALFPEIHARHFFQPDGYSPYLSGFTKETYLDLLRRIVLGSEAAENVILLEIFPDKQKTRIDFHATEGYLGIRTVCLTDIEQDGRKLYYRRDGVRTEVRRIYNRLIIDDLYQQAEEVRAKGSIFQQDLDVTWVPHPNWFYRISKYSLPFIRHPYVPETRFLSDVREMPTDLDQFVVKPLFSFAGQGVIIDVTAEAIEGIPDPQNWIIQRKVDYAPVIETPTGPAKAEIRLFYFWEEGAARPVAANNLARLSKGKMVGVRYNQDKDWVGGTFCLFEK
ncbi:MAG: hypothetical protein JWP27_2939 [Flaviaesturariibacter sp.]|nr:hypothetical protein [Flaviaesturariibacter sp.]